MRRVEDFWLRANFPLDQRPQLVPELVALQRDLTTMLQLDSPQKPVHLILFSDRNSYIRYLQRYFEGAPQRRALFIKGSQPGWVFAYLNDKFLVDVRHETTHALLHSRLPTVPLWLDEGLAEYFEVKAGDREDGSPHELLIKWGARFRRVPDLEELEELREVREMDKADYRAAWAWVHFLLHGPPAAREVLLEYLGAMRRTTPPGRFRVRLEKAVPDVNSAFLRHHR